MTPSEGNCVLMTQERLFDELVQRQDALSFQEQVGDNSEHLLMAKAQVQEWTALNSIFAIHAPMRLNPVQMLFAAGRGQPLNPKCIHCQTDYPCVTIRALVGGFCPHSVQNHE